MKKILLQLILTAVPFCSFAQIESLDSIVAGLPLLPEPGDRINYEGSIDPDGGNVDYDWYLYRDGKGEWVIMEAEGPGELLNFVQHRYVTSTDPHFRIYVDDAEEPYYEFNLSELGVKFPFVKPVSDCYIGPLGDGWGPIRVGHSFVPVPFGRHIRVTSDIKLYGADREKDEGGWGHIIYRTFPEARNTIGTPEERPAEMKAMKRRGLEIGKDPEILEIPSTRIAPGRTCELASFDSAAVISAIRLNIKPLRSSGYCGIVRDLWISIRFDGHSSPDICCPLGAFCGNYMGCNDSEFLLMGMDQGGNFYNTFPMPFWKDCSITLQNRSSQEITLLGGMIKSIRNSYPQESAGYFRNSPFYERSHTEGADSPIASVTGYGRLVASQVTCWAPKEGDECCEGDYHVYIDGRRNPVVQSDGSESYANYGWGFPTPPESHPFGGYDGKDVNPWSETRLNITDSFPFYNRLALSVESGESNNQYLEHAGTVFYYGVDTPVLELAERIPAGEGTVSFRVKLPKGNRGLSVVREFRQVCPSQRARVSVDGRTVSEHDWLYVSNGRFRDVSDDSFEIPVSYLKGKRSAVITVEPLDSAWNASSYSVWVYGR